MKYDDKNKKSPYRQSLRRYLQAGLNELKNLLSLMKVLSKAITKKVYRICS